jgi:hypothetical protein
MGGTEVKKFISFFGLILLLITAVPGAHAATNVLDRQEIKYSVRDSVLNEKNGYIYAISNGTVLEDKNRLLYIRTTDLKIEKEFNLNNGTLKDIEILNGKLFVLGRDLIVFDIASSSIEKTIKLEHSAEQIAVDDKQVFYTAKLGSVEFQPIKLFVYDLNSQSNREIVMEKDFRDPVIALNQDNDMLYIAERKVTGARIEAISTVNYKKLHEFVTNSADFFDGYSKITVDRDQLYYAGHRFDAKLDDVLEEYKHDIVYAKGNYTFTKHAVFDRSKNNKKIMNLPLYSSHFMVDDSDTMYMFTSDVGTFEIHKVKYTDQLKAPAYNVVHDGWIRIDPKSSAVNAIVFQDFKETSNYAKEAIRDLAASQIISGDEKGNFNPQKTATRAELVKILVELKQLNTSDLPEQPTFKDVSKTHWAYKYVEAAYRAGIVAGINKDTFGVQEKITREQMATMFIRALGLSADDLKENGNYIERFSDKNLISDWARGFVSFSDYTGLMKGTSETNFKPKSGAKREQMAVLAYRLLNNIDSLLTTSEAFELASLAQISVDDKSNFIVTLAKPADDVKVISIRDNETGEEIKQYLQIPRSFGQAPNVYLESAGITPGASYTLKYSVELDGKVSYGEKEVHVADNRLAIESVVPLNAVQIKVNFNEMLDQKTAKELKHYRLSDKNGEASIKSVNMSERSVILTLDKPIQGKEKLYIEVQGIKSWNQELFPTYETFFIVHDRTNPTFASPIYDDENYYVTEHYGPYYTSLKIYFSEPVISGIVKIDGQTIGDVAGESFIATGLKIDATKRHNVSVEDLTDTAFNAAHLSISLQPIERESAFYPVTVNDVTNGIDTIVANQKIGRDITHWVLDEKKGYIYALSDKTNELLFIRLNDLQVEKELHVGSKPSDLEVIENKLYVALSGDSKIVVVNTDTKGIASTLTLDKNPYCIAVDGNQVFYVPNVGIDAGAELRMYNMSDGTDKKITIQGHYYTSYSNPDIAIDRINHILYIGESENSGSNIEAISTKDYARLHKSNYKDGYGFAYPQRKVILNGKDIFYAEHRLDANDLAKIQGHYNDHIVAVYGKYAFSEQKVYNRQKFNKIMELPFASKYILMDSSENIYLFDMVEQSLLKLKIN